jgi:hypothetical protein
MSVRVLELDQFRLSDSEDGIEWSVSPFIHTTIPESVCNKRNEEIIKGLTSGNIWATRGAHLSLDFYVMAGHLLDSPQKLQLCESLAYSIRDTCVSTHKILRTIC